MTNSSDLTRITVLVPGNLSNHAAKLGAKAALLACFAVASSAAYRTMRHCVPM